MWHIPQTARIGSDKSCVWVNVVRKTVSPIFLLRSTLVTLEAEKYFFIFLPSWRFIIFLSLHMMLSTLLILAVCRNDLAHLGVSVVHLQSIMQGAKVWASTLYDSEFFLFNSFDRIKEKKTFFMCLSKINKQHNISTGQDWIFCGRGTQVSKEFGILHF